MIFPRFLAFFIIPMISRLVYPVRVGEHSNSAFGLAMALDYTRFPIMLTVKDDNNDIVIKIKTMIKVGTLSCHGFQLHKDSV